MKFWPVLLAVTLAVGTAAQATDPTVAAMHNHRRIVAIAAPPGNSAAVDQRRILRDWGRQAADRDISVVEVSGEQVTGAGDTAASLRERYGLKPGKFQLLLIGKDGTVALRSTRPVTSRRLQAVIDAMPMRRAGER